jgi:hypothetical protein
MRIQKMLIVWCSARSTTDWLRLVRTIWMLKFGNLIDNNFNSVSEFPITFGFLIHHQFKLILLLCNLLIVRILSQLDYKPLFKQQSHRWVDKNTSCDEITVAVVAHNTLSILRIVEGLKQEKISKPILTICILCQQAYPWVSHKNERCIEHQNKDDWKEKGFVSVNLLPMWLGVAECNCGDNVLKVWN